MPHVRTVLLAALLTVGCHGRLGSGTPDYLVQVDALRAPDATKYTTYYLFPGMKGVEPGSLQFLEYSAYVHRVLQSRGFKLADSPASAQVAIFLSYGIGEPQVTYHSVSYPIYGMVSGGQTSTVNVSTSGYGAASTTTTGTISTGPEYGVVGTGTRTETSVAYHRYLQLSAVDVKSYLARQEIREVWRTTVRSTGSSGDLRRVMPVLVAAARNAVATSTGRATEFWLREDDERVEFVRKAPLIEPPPLPARTVQTRSGCSEDAQCGADRICAGGECRPADLTPPASTPGDTHPSTGGCQYDAQCKGDRICVDGECAAPAAPMPTPNKPSSPDASPR